MFDSCRGQDNVSEKPRVVSATVPRGEARVNGIVVSSSAGKQTYLRRRWSRFHESIGAQAKQALSDGFMEEQLVLSVPGQKEVATSSGCSVGAVCSAAAMGAEILVDCSAGWSRSRTSETVEEELLTRNSANDRRKSLPAVRDNSELSSSYGGGIL